MDNKNKRPTERGKTSVMKEQPRTPASRPKDPRPRTGNAASREAARKERLDQKEEAAKQARHARNRSAEPWEQPGSNRSDEPWEREQKLRKRKKKKPLRVYNTNFVFKFVIMLSVVAVIVLSMVIFFKVKHIEVLLPTDEAGQTQSYYTEDEIRNASGINLDDNLLSLSKATAAAQIHASLPYINEVQIKKQLPGTVIITVSEFDVTYGIQDETGGWWLMSRDGRILEAADEKSVGGHLTVTGMPIQVPQVGDTIKPAATDGADMSEIANKQTVVLQIIPALEKSSFVKDIDRVDVSTSYDLTLWWTAGRYAVKLGTTERLEYKLQYLQTILQNGSIENKSGTLDLTFNEDGSAHFLPFP